MAQRRHHYEQAFEDYLRARRIPYVAVDEAKKALLPEPTSADSSAATGSSLKSFDFVIYGQGYNLLTEVKGRKISRTTKPGQASTPSLPSTARLESWVTLDDVASLQQWEQLFGPEFQAVFVFVYWCDEQPPDSLFQEMFECRGRWYALRAIKVRDYTGVMKVRSTKWRTVYVPTRAFETLSSPFAPPSPSSSQPVDQESLSLEFRAGLNLPTLERLAF